MFDLFSFASQTHSVLFFFFSAELPENWTDTRETLLEGMTFNLRHLGMTLVDQPKGEELSAAAVKRIVATVCVCVSVDIFFQCMDFIGTVLLTEINI